MKKIIAWIVVSVLALLLISAIFMTFRKDMPVLNAILGTVGVFGGIALIIWSVLEVTKDE